MSHRFTQVDVFSASPTRGNALVVTDLPAMRRIAAQGWKLRRFDDAAHEGKGD